MTEKSNILCSRLHEYVYEEDGNYIIGITDRLIARLGDIIFLELPKIGVKYNKGEIIGYAESNNAASEIYMPISGTIIDINEQLVEKPELLNKVPFYEAWLIKINCDFFKEDSLDLIGYNTYKEEDC